MTVRSNNPNTPPAAPQSRPAGSPQGAPSRTSRTRVDNSDASAGRLAGTTAQRDAVSDEVQLTEDVEVMRRNNKVYYDLGKSHDAFRPGRRGRNTETVNTKKLREKPFKKLVGSVDATRFSKVKKRPKSWYDNNIKAAKELLVCKDLLDRNTRQWLDRVNSDGLVNELAKMGRYDAGQFSKLKKDARFKDKIYSKDGLFQILLAWQRATNIHPELKKASGSNFELDSLGLNSGCVELRVGRKARSQRERYAEKRMGGEKDNEVVEAPPKPKKKPSPEPEPRPKPKPRTTPEPRPKPKRKPRRDPEPRPKPTRNPGPVRPVRQAPPRPTPVPGPKPAPVVTPGPVTAPPVPPAAPPVPPAAPPVASAAPPVAGTTTTAPVASAPVTAPPIPAATALPTPIPAGGAPAPASAPVTAPPIPAATALPTPIPAGGAPAPASAPVTAPPIPAVASPVAGTITAAPVPLAAPAGPVVAAAASAAAASPSPTVAPTGTTATVESAELVAVKQKYEALVAQAKHYFEQVKGVVYRPLILHADLNLDFIKSLRKKVMTSLEAGQGIYINDAFVSKEDFERGYANLSVAIADVQAQMNNLDKYTSQLLIQEADPNFILRLTPANVHGISHITASGALEVDALLPTVQLETPRIEFKKAGAFYSYTIVRKVADQEVEQKIDFYAGLLPAGTGIEVKQNAGEPGSYCFELRSGEMTAYINVDSEGRLLVKKNPDSANDLIAGYDLFFGPARINYFNFPMIVQFRNIEMGLNET